MAQNNMDALAARWPSLRDPLAEEPTAENSAVETVDTDTDNDPLADLPPETVAMAADEAAPADERGGLGSSPQTRASSQPPLSVTEASRLLAESHLRNARATDSVRAANGNVAVALQRFQTATMQTQNFEGLVREHIKSENQLRADRVAGRIAPRPQRRLGSAVDAFAFHTKESGRGTGGGRAFGRGAYPKSMRGRVIPK